jgi:transposase
MADGLVAPRVLDGPINGEAFLVYVEKVLAPCLSAMTSWRSTICLPTRSRVSAPRSRPGVASLLHLPPYSPDLNPIGMAFVKFNTLLRRAVA